MEVEQAAADTDLGQLLVSSEVEALISADAPKASLIGDPTAARLFENYMEVDPDSSPSSDLTS